MRAALRLCGVDLADQPGHNWLLLKTAGQIGDISKSFGNAFNTLQSGLGGPNALTTTLVGAGLGGLGGHVLGRVADNVVPAVSDALLPEEYAREARRLRFTPALTAAGAGLGAVPGLLRGSVALSNGKSPLSAYPWADLNDSYSKAANATGALFVPSIPVDAFNQAVWSDVHGPANPFGTKSRWGDNTQELYTPASAATLAAGLVNAAGAARGSDWVSPWDVGRVAMQVTQGGVAGAVAGLMVGKTLGMLAGLSPQAQNAAKRTGLWAGALTGLSKALL